MDFVVTVPDLVVPRILAALATPTIPIGSAVPAKAGDVPGILKAYLQSLVTSYEAGQAAQTKQASVAQESW